MTQVTQREAPYRDDELAAWGLTRRTLPRHIAIIMDGNGRWASSRSLPRIEGHRRGVNTVRAIVTECARLNLEQLTLYAFSSENWKRPALEQRLLMQLFRQFLVEERAELIRQDLRFNVIGRREGLGKDVLVEVDRTTEICQHHQGMRLCLAVNYGSRSELADAARRIASDALQGNITLDQIDESAVADRLYTAGMPDPDLLIRSAGELRISNYLLWQISYAEIWVSPKCWPDFSVDDLREACRAFAARDRRFGGLTS